MKHDLDYLYDEINSVQNYYTGPVTMSLLNTLVLKAIHKRNIDQANTPNHISTTLEDECDATESDIY